MILLHPHQPKVLMCLSKQDRLRSDPTIKTWRTYYRLRARVNDGHIVWEGWTQDRDDCDEALRCIAIGHIPRETREYFTPSWPSYLDDIGVYYCVDTVTFLTATAATDWPVPLDWNNGANTIEVIGGGAGAGGGGDASANGGGGGAGAYSAVTNLARPAGANFKYLAGGAGAGGAVVSDGGSGADSWFSNTTVAPTTTAEGALAKAGVKGLGTGGHTGGAGGTAAASIGITKNDGGTGGTQGVTGGGGGGGAGYSSAAGGNGVAGSGTCNGGAGAGAGGGTAGAGGGPGTAGGNGTNWDGTHGTGGGGGGDTSHGAFPGAAGGNYGGAGGGGSTDGCGANTAGGAGKQGLVVTTYTPFIPVPGLYRIDSIFRRTTVVAY